MQSEDPNGTAPDEDSYDAIVLISFGGPEAPEDVREFLENVTRGRDVPSERLDAVAEQYMLFGGKSPINDLNRDLIRALSNELGRRGVSLPVYWGNRNWHPFLSDTVQTMADDGVTRAIGLVTSAYSGYSGCRQYLDDIAAAVAAANRPITVDKVRPFWNHPGFIDSNAAHVREALSQLSTARRKDAKLVFTAHSIPQTLATSCDYVEQLHDAATLVVSSLSRSGDVASSECDLVYQSRSGPPQVPWLGPDISDHLHALSAGGTETVVVCPIGFVADHMEVVFDLDTKAKAVADGLGLTMVRAKSAGTHPAFVSGLVDLIDELLSPDADPKALGRLGPRQAPCHGKCCPGLSRRS